MKIIEREGKTTSSVIADFMKEFDLTLDNFRFKVTDEGSSGFLRLFGSKPVKIQFILPDITDDIKEITEKMLRLLNVSYKDITVKEGKNIYLVDISDVQEAGFLIGKSAKLLDSLQHILSQMLNKKYKKQVKLSIDVNNYRERKRASLISKLKDIVKKVKFQNKSFTFEPLNSADRKIIHKFVEKEKDLRTMTIGDGNLKKVVVMPVNKDKKRRESKNYHKTA